MTWAQFWQAATIAFFAGMATGVWLGLRRHRIPPVSTLANVTPPTTTELYVGVRSQPEDDEPRPIQVGDEVLLFPIIEGADAIRAMFAQRNPPRTPGPYETGVCPECGRLVEIEWVDATAPGGYVDRVPGRWLCRTVGCKYGEPASTITIHLDNASGTFTPTGPRYPPSIDIPLDFQAGTFTPDGPRPEFGEESAT